MPLKLPEDAKYWCYKCGGFIPMHHFQYALQQKGCINTSYNLCSDCAASWNDEIQKHFLEWIEEDPHGQEE